MFVFFDLLPLKNPYFLLERLVLDDSSLQKLFQFIDLLLVPARHFEFSDLLLVDAALVSAGRNIYLLIA